MKCFKIVEWIKSNSVMRVTVHVEKNTHRDYITIKNVLVQSSGNVLQVDLTVHDIFAYVLLGGQVESFKRM